MSDQLQQDKTVKSHGCIIVVRQWAPAQLDTYQLDKTASFQKEAMRTHVALWVFMK